MEFIFHDGGRKAAGFKGGAGDCVTRAIAIVTGKPYLEIYERLAVGMSTQRASKYTTKKQRTARNGINVTRKWFKDYMIETGFNWVPTMGIGTGCKIHLHDDELPKGRLVVSLSKHYTAVIDGDVYDTYDPRRDVHHIEPYQGQELKPGQWITKGNINGGDGLAWVSRRCVYGYWVYKI